MGVELYLSAIAVAMGYLLICPGLLPAFAAAIEEGEPVFYTINTVLGTAYQALGCGEFE